MAHLIAPDGREFDVPDENVEAAVAAGWKMPGDAGGAPAPAQPAPQVQAEMVPMRAPDGREFDVPSNQLQAALDAGWATNTTLGQQVRTGLEGAARGVSLGISDAIQAGGAGLGTALGNALADDMGPGPVERAAGPGIGAPLAEPQAQVYDDQAAKQALEGIRTRQAADPEIAIASEVAGAIAPALLTGGTSGAAQAAGFTPAGVSSLLAARVQAAVAKEGAKALGRIGGLAAAGATEAAAQSATRRVVDDLVAGDHELSAERMLTGLGGVIEDAALGGLTGGLIGGAVEGSQAAYRLGKGLLGKMGGKAAQEAAQPALTFDLTLGPAEAAEAAGPLTARELPNVADNAGSGIVQAARGAATEFGDVQQGAVRAVAKDMDDLLRAGDYIDEHAGLAAKRLNAARMQADPERAFGAFQTAREAVEEIELSAKSMIDEYGEAALQDRGGLAVLKRIETGARDTMKRVVHKLENGDFGDAAMALDDYKRILGSAQNAKNPLIQARVRANYERMRTMLEDESVWGEFATKQKPVNAAITEKIRRSGDDLVRRFFRTSGDAAADPFERLTQSNSEALGSMLSRIGDAEVEPTESALRLYLRSLAVDAKTRAAAWGTPELVAKADEMAGAVERIESRMNAVAYAKKDAQAWQKVMNYAPGTAGGVLRGAAKLGQLTITPIKRLADAAVKQQQAVQQAAEQAREVLMGAAAPRALKATVSARNIMMAVNRARALQDESSPESARLRQATLEIAHDDPAFAQVLAAKEKQKAAFLASKAGPAVDTSDPFGAKPMRLDRVSAGKLERYAAAVEDPGESLKRLANGTGSAEELEAIQTVYPRLYATFVQLVQEQMARVKVPPTMQQRQRLHRATGVPMAREHDPEYIAWAQSMAQPEQPPEQAQQQGQRSGFAGQKDIDLKPDEHYGNRSDQVLAGGP